MQTDRGMSSPHGKGLFQYLSMFCGYLKAFTAHPIGQPLGDLHTPSGLPSSKSLSRAVRDLSLRIKCVPVPPHSSQLSLGNPGRPATPLPPAIGGVGLCVCMCVCSSRIFTAFLLADECDDQDVCSLPPLCDDSDSETQMDDIPLCPPPAAFRGIYMCLSFCNWE